MVEVYQMASAKNQSKKYRLLVDIDEQTISCNCPAGSYGKPCWHAKTIQGNYNFRNVTLTIKEIPNA